MDTFWTFYDKSKDDDVPQEIVDFRGPRPEDEV
jgi:hypothetical protein